MSLLLVLFLVLYNHVVGLIFQLLISTRSMEYLKCARSPQVFTTASSLGVGTFGAFVFEVVLLIVCCFGESLLLM